MGDTSVAAVPGVAGVPGVASGCFSWPSLAVVAVRGALCDLGASTATPAASASFADAALPAPTHAGLCSSLKPYTFFASS